MEAEFLTAEIYSKGPGQPTLLFRFKRTASRSGSTLNVLREFNYPDGTPAAREQVAYNEKGLASYELDEVQTHGHGTAKVLSNPSKSSKRIAFSYTPDTTTGARAKTSEEALRPDTLVGDMVGPFLASHWNQLARGETVKCRYVVVPRRETVGFSFSKESESLWHGREVINVKMEPSSVIIAALVDPLHFAIEKSAQHRVLEVVGRTTPKIRSGNRWADLDAVTVFDWK